MFENMATGKNKTAKRVVLTVPEKIKEIRKKLGDLSQEVFARESKISTSLLAKMEGGKVNPSLDFMTVLYTRWLVNPSWWNDEPGHEDAMFTGAPAPVEGQGSIKSLVDPWKDVALTEVARRAENAEGERDSLRKEVDRLWGMVHKFMSGELNFLQRVEGAA